MKVEVNILTHGQVVIVVINMDPTKQVSRYLHQCKYFTFKLPSSDGSLNKKTSLHLLDTDLLRHILTHSDLSSSHGAECIDEPELDGEISHCIHIFVTFLHHFGNSLVNRKKNNTKSTLKPLKSIKNKTFDSFSTTSQPLLFQGTYIAGLDHTIYI